jgi:hypothetical protein
VTPAQFANQQGFNLGLSAVTNLTNATVVSAPNRANTPVKNVNDNLSIARNAHNLNFGWSFSQINRWSVTQTIVPSITFGVDTTDRRARCSRRPISLGRLPRT